MGQVERGQAEEVCRWGRWRYNCRRSAWSQMKEKGKAFLTHVWLRLETFSVHASHIELLPLQFWTFLNSIFSPYMAFYSPFCVYLRWAQSDMALLSSQSFLFLVNANVSWLQMIASDSGFFFKAESEHHHASTFRTDCQSKFLPLFGTVLPVQMNLNSKTCISERGTRSKHCIFVREEKNYIFEVSHLAVLASVLPDMTKKEE